MEATNIRVDLDKERIKRAEETLPPYMRTIANVETGLKTLPMRLTVLGLEMLVWVILKPRLSKPGALDQSEVDQVYSREAKTYEKKHHLTTHGHDDNWRREIAFSVLPFLEREHSIILDLCTGVGLSVEWIVKILTNFGRTDIDVIGLDYNNAMLAQAANALPQLRKVGRSSNINARFVRGDVTDLVSRKSYNDGLHRFEESSVDVATMICGIGGIKNDNLAFQQILQTLRVGGGFTMIDMHRPIPEFSGTFFIGSWLRSPSFEKIAYHGATVPLVLKRLWGWKDPTMSFYNLPLTTCQSGSRYFGFETVYFELRTDSWWFGLPFVPTAKITVKKIEISPTEFKKRNQIKSRLKS